MRSPLCLDVGKGSEYASAECKVNCLKISKVSLQTTTEQIWAKILKSREAYLEKYIFGKAANIVTPSQLHYKYCLIGLCTF